MIHILHQTNLDILKHKQLPESKFELAERCLIIYEHGQSISLTRCTAEGTIAGDYITIPLHLLKPDSKNNCIF